MNSLNSETTKFNNYFFDLILIWGAILIYKTVPYYNNFLRNETKTTIIFLALAYKILGLGYCLLTPPKKISPSKGTIIFNFLGKISKKIFSKRSFFPKITNQEKNALLFTLVKFFFLPIMLNFFFNNFPKTYLSRFALS